MSEPVVGVRAPVRAPVRLLVAGDLRLGRPPLGVPPGEPGLDVAAVVSATADLALARGVDALVLTGALVEPGNEHFEATGVLDRLFRRLAGAGLPVFVADPSDAVASVIGLVGSTLIQPLGRSETWGSAPITRDGHDVLRLVGRSSFVPNVPVPPFPAGPGSDVPTVGVLHTAGDMSENEPVDLADLRALPVAAWVLGSGHVPTVLAEGDGPLVLAPGVLQPLSPDEAGVHSAFLVTVAADGTATAEAVSLATLHYGTVEVDLAEAATAADARTLCAAALREHAALVREASPAVVRAVVRVRLTGRTAAFSGVDALAAELRTDADLPHAGLTVAVARVEVAAAPLLDLGRLAAGSGAVATLARLSARLGTDGPLDPAALAPADRALLARASDAVRSARGARVFEPLAADGRLDSDLGAEAASRLRRQVSRLLDAALTPHADG